MQTLHSCMCWRPQMKIVFWTCLNDTLVIHASSRSVCATHQTNSYEFQSTSECWVPRHTVRISPSHHVWFWLPLWRHHVVLNCLIVHGWPICIDRRRFQPYPCQQTATLTCNAFHGEHISHIWLQSCSQHPQLSRWCLAGLLKLKYGICIEHL